MKRSLIKIVTPERGSEKCGEWENLKAQAVGWNTNETRQDLIRLRQLSFQSRFQVKLCVKSLAGIKNFLLRLQSDILLRLRNF